MLVLNKLSISNLFTLKYIKCIIKYKIYWISYKKQAQGKVPITDEIKSIPWLWSVRKSKEGKGEFPIDSKGYSCNNGDSYIIGSVCNRLLLHPFQ